MHVESHLLACLNPYSIERIILPSIEAWQTYLVRVISYLLARSTLSCGDTISIDWNLKPYFNRSRLANSDSLNAHCHVTLFLSITSSISRTPTSSDRGLRVTWYSGDHPTFLAPKSTPLTLMVDQDHPMPKHPHLAQRGWSSHPVLPANHPKGPGVVRPSLVLAVRGG